MDKQSLVTDDDISQQRSICLRKRAEHFCVTKMHPLCLQIDPLPGSFNLERQLETFVRLKNHFQDVWMWISGFDRMKD